jgi:DNA-directed RNA polymerase I, II, and III subunit RPABC5
MIIAIRCMNCGMPLADKWRWFELRVAELRTEMGITNSSSPMYMDGTKVPVTPEGQALDELGLHRYCCRAKILTCTNLNEKV